MNQFDIRAIFRERADRHSSHRLTPDLPDRGDHTVPDPGPVTDVVSGDVLDKDGQKVKDSQEIPLPVRIVQMEKHFQYASPKGFASTMLIRDGLTLLRSVKDLNECEPLSVLGALMNCAQLGLRPGVNGQAYILPFFSKDDDCYYATFIAGYRGLSGIATRSGRIRSMTPRTVREGDRFAEVISGSVPKIDHTPDPSKTGRHTGYYVLVAFADGGVEHEYMTYEEVISHRDMYAKHRDKRGRPTGIWLKHHEAMAWKTVIRRKAKYLPGDLDLDRVLHADESIRTNIDADATPEHASVQIGETF